jgi:hypothetical protein
MQEATAVVAAESAMTKLARDEKAEKAQVNVPLHFLSTCLSMCLNRQLDKGKSLGGRRV